MLLITILIFQKLFFNSYKKHKFLLRLYYSSCINIIFNKTFSYIHLNNTFSIPGENFSYNFEIETFFRNTQKYLESFNLQNFSYVNSEIFWDFSSHDFWKIFKNFLNFITFHQKLYLQKILKILRYFIINIYGKFWEKNLDFLRSVQIREKKMWESYKIIQKFWKNI